MPFYKDSKYLWQLESNEFVPELYIFDAELWDSEDRIIPYKLAEYLGFKPIDPKTVPTNGGSVSDVSKSDFDSLKSDFDNFKDNASNLNDFGYQVITLNVPGTIQQDILLQQTYQTIIFIEFLDLNLRSINNISGTIRDNGTILRIKCDNPISVSQKIIFIGSREIAL